jgi:hypothetical protein
MSRPVRSEPRSAVRAVSLYSTQASAFEAALAEYNTTPSHLLRRWATAAMIAEGFLPPGTPAEPPPAIRR